MRLLLRHRRNKEAGTMNKIVYEIPEMERITLEETDIITSSPGEFHADESDCLIDVENGNGN